MKMRNFLLVHIILFVIVMIFSDRLWPFFLLTIAQLLYIPIILRLIITRNDWFSRTYYLFAIPAYFSIAMLQIFPSTWDMLFAAVYLFFTCVIALYGFSRFLNRGFINFEEFSIDIGLIYLAMGGAWFFAYTIGFDTGFSPLITWLTAIHFHYSAFILPIFIGFLGRINQTRFYKRVASILIISPMIVAIGITFSRWIELLSVILYIIGLFGLILMTWRTVFQATLQKWLIRISFTALGLTILFSLLYALSNGFGLLTVSIHFMLLFHGILNCIVFAMVGICGWMIAVPPAKFLPPCFPASQIKGKFMPTDSAIKRGLVDDMNVFQPFINRQMLSPMIIDFYENTNDYRLFATVKWQTWFYLFVFVYKFMSRKMEQINLPISQKEVEMTGAIHPISSEQDGRQNVRAWVRKIKDETAFVALYAIHEKSARTYMNIALPLPFSSMYGILALQQKDDALQLTSQQLDDSMTDAGIYLAFCQKIFKLPIEENFIVCEEEGILFAKHQMWIFSLPFLTIHYRIIQMEV